MIQRKQTLFLLIAVICCVILYFSPVAHIKSNGLEYVFHISGIRSVAPGSGFGISTLPLLVLLGLIGAISSAGIFLYKNRPFQARICILGIVLTAVLGCFLVFHIFSTNASEVNIAHGLFIPLPILVFLFLALRGIRKDEKLVKSLDRIR